MRQPGYSYLELLCVLAIATIGYVTVIPSLYSFIYRIQASLTMQQIQQAINYGRSQAIAQGKSVILCPSISQQTCAGAWQDGILVVAPSDQTRFFRVYLAPYSHLTLIQSGFSTQKMTIQGSGLTHSNGSFNYKSLKFGALPQFHLYFNKVLRLYTVNG